MKEDFRQRIAAAQAGDKPARKRPAPKGGKQNEDYQPSLERIRKNDEWLDEFLKQQGKEV